MADPLPRRFGKYVLQRRLGVGGMAETFVARRDGAVEQLVCVKRVLPAFNTDEDFIAQFVREARVAAKLRHSNIVGILDFGEVESEHYMALELVDGIDMRGLLHNEPGSKLAAELATLIAIQIAYALEYAHASEGGIVHRDVTPSNILLSTHGEVKLADFGVAKALTGTSVATATGFIKGKVPYMAPEQMRGAEIDGRVDLFSLGVTLFEALSGRRPFVGKHDVEVMMKVLEGQRPKLQEVAPEVPVELAAVVERLLESDRDERYADAGEVVDALAPFVTNEEKARDRLAEKVRAGYGVDLGGEMATHDTELAVELPRVVAPPDAPVAPVEAASAPRPATMIDAPSTPSPRRRALLAAGVAVVVALTGMVGAFALQNEDPLPENPLAETPTTEVTPAEQTMTEIPRGELPPVETMVEDTMVEVAQPMTMRPTMVTMATMEAEPDMEPEETMRRGRGRVRFTVSPWGRVYFRGMSHRAPHTFTLPVGSHRIGIGQESPITHRTVRIEANKEQRIHVNLDE